MDKNISVIICTYNRQKRLSVTLGSFSHLQVPEAADWELVVVNNSSTDNTEDVIHSFRGRLPISYVHEPKQGLSRARNTGLENAQGELIIFTDDDIKPDPCWMTAYWEAYRKRPEGYFFGGPIESEFEADPPDEDLLRVAMPSVAGLDYGHEARSLESDEYFIGPNWACPAKYLEQVGAFDAELGLNPAAGKVQVGEEADLMRRLERMGVKGWYVPEARIRHFVPSEKATLEHVADRLTARSGSTFEKGSPLPFSLSGHPLGLYKNAFISGVKFLIKRILGYDHSGEYIQWVRWRKRINEFRQAWKEGRI